jgi:hypothetical protein
LNKKSSVKIFPDEATSVLTPQVTAYAFGVRAVYQLPTDQQDGCSLISGTRCPLSAGEFATYTMTMPVSVEYPLTPLDIEVRMFDQNQKVMFCVLTKAEVVIG